MANGDPVFFLLSSDGFLIICVIHRRGIITAVIFYKILNENHLDIYVFPITHVPRNIKSCVNALRYGFKS